MHIEKDTREEKKHKMNKRKNNVERKWAMHVHAYTWNGVNIKQRISRKRRKRNVLWYHCTALKRVYMWMAQRQIQ